MTSLVVTTNLTTCPLILSSGNTNNSRLPQTTQLITHYTLSRTVQVIVQVSTLCKRVREAASTLAGSGAAAVEQEACNGSRKQQQAATQPNGQAEDEAQVAA